MSIGALSLSERRLPAPLAGHPLTFLKDRMAAAWTRQGNLHLRRLDGRRNPTTSAATPWAATLRGARDRRHPASLARIPVVEGDPDRFHAASTVLDRMPGGEKRDPARVSFRTAV